MYFLFEQRVREHLQDVLPNKFKVVSVGTPKFSDRQFENIDNYFPACFISFESSNSDLSEDIREDITSSERLSIAITIAQVTRFSDGMRANREITALADSVKAAFRIRGDLPTWTPEDSRATRATVTEVNLTAVNIGEELNLGDIFVESYTLQLESKVIYHYPQD